MVFYQFYIVLPHDCLSTFTSGYYIIWSGWLPPRFLKRPLDAWGALEVSRITYPFETKCQSIMTVERLPFKSHCGSNKKLPQLVRLEQRPRKYKNIQKYHPYENRSKLHVPICLGFMYFRLRRTETMPKVFLGRPRPSPCFGFPSFGFLVLQIMP